jgi:N,N-dimethylformamidase beta subunit-like protein
MILRPLRIFGLIALVGLVVVWVASGFPNQGPPPIKPLPRQPTPEEALKQAVIVGYANRWSVQPGQTVRFMVSSERPRYHAEIVRLFHAVPKGPGLKEARVDTPVNGDYRGRHQDLGLGSYATVRDRDALDLTKSFTITAWVAPTTIPRSSGNPLAARQTPARSPRPQGILTKVSAGRAGYGLFIGNDGSPSLWLGNGRRIERLSTGTALRPWAPAFPEEAGYIEKIPGDPNPLMVNSSSRWYFVAASYDARSGRVVLYQNPLNHISDPTRRTVERTSTVRGIAKSGAPLLMAAGRRADTGAVGDFYNGKIDNPRLYDRALTRGEIRAIGRGDGPSDAVGSWDFSAGIRSARVIDASRRGLNGRAVNLPARGVTGHNWRKRVLDYRRAPRQYGAIYFHQDDLGDARWRADFSYRVPRSLESGVYAAKLRAGDKTFYVPFFVRPRRPTARIALLMETDTYLAYGQTGVPNLLGPSSLSVYSRHADGSGTTYTTRLRPITSGQPSGPARHFPADTFIVDWLREKGFKADVITDEDVAREGVRILRPYRVVLTSTHPEYPTSREYGAFDSYVQHGGRLMYMGGNGFYWVTGLGRGGRYLEVRRRDGTEAWQAAPGESHLTTTGEEGGLYRFRGRPPQELLGVGFTAQAYGSTLGPGETGRPYKRMPDSFEPETAFIFRGVGRDELIGDAPNLAPQSPGAAGDELDRVDYIVGSPPNTHILATATGFPDSYQHVVEEVLQEHSTGGGTVNPLVRADLAYLKYRNGGAVFSTGSISWSGVLSYNNYSNNVSRVTENVLRRFVSGAPLP